MSGKTTFIRTVMLNALLGETLCTCFAERFTAPYMRLHSSIRISDDITEGTSYYLQEVLTVKRLLEDADRPAACLFVLDELFKGTNTTERIAAGKAVLARLNRGPHIVLAATHDIELAELLRGDGYELHHFREEVADGRLVFDYCLHTGPLTTRNAIRILELYDYPPELIAEAYDTQQKLLGNGYNRARSVQKPERAQNRTGSPAAIFRPYAPVPNRAISAASATCGSPARRHRSAGRKSAI